MLDDLFTDWSETDIFDLVLIICTLYSGVDTIWISRYLMDWNDMTYMEQRDWTRFQCQATIILYVSSIFGLIEILFFSFVHLEHVDNTRTAPFYIYWKILSSSFYTAVIIIHYAGFNICGKKGKDKVSDVEDEEKEEEVQVEESQEVDS